MWVWIRQPPLLTLALDGLASVTAFWYPILSVLAAPLPHGVRADPGPEYNATTLCTFIADLTAGQAVIANRGEQPVTIPLRDLAEGRPRTD